MGKLILSVMIPAYNASSTLATSVKSALRDLPQDSEVLIYFDGPDPKASKVVEAINDDRIRVLESSENCGVSHARNMLIEHAKGEFVANLDADDISLPNRFKRQIDLLQAGYGDIVFSNSIHLKKWHKAFTVRPNLPFAMGHKVSPIALALFNPFVNSTMASKVATIAGLGEYTNAAAPAEDYEMWMRASLKRLRLARDNRYSVLYRVHENQISQTVKSNESLQSQEILLNSKRLIWSELGILDSNGQLDKKAAKRLLINSSKTAEIELLGIKGFLKQLSFPRNLEKP